MVTYEAIDMEDDGAEPVQVEMDTPRALTVVPDTATPGDTLHVIGETGSGNQEIFQYNLSTPFDITSASFDQSFQFLEGADAHALDWNTESGFDTLAYVAFNNGNLISYEFPDFDISTGGFSDSTDVSGNSPNPRGIAVSNDGSRFVIVDADQTVIQYTAGTNSDISTLSVDFTFDSGDDFINGDPSGAAFSQDGRLFFVSMTQDDIMQYRLSTPYDLSTRTYEGAAAVNNSQDDTQGVYQSDVRIYSAGLDPFGDAWTTQYLGNAILNVPRANTSTAPRAPAVTGDGTATIDPPQVTLTTTSQNPLVGIPEWTIDGDIIKRPVSEVVTPKRIRLEFRSTSNDLLTILRPLKTDEGKVDVIGTDSGGFRAVDRANGGNTFNLKPPIQRIPFREEGDVHVAQYEESLVTQDVSDWQVELEFQRDAERIDSPSISETPDADEWGITTRYGTIATPRVSADLLGTGEGGVERYEITARLTRQQSRVFESALNRLGAARIREIPDAPNVAVDDSDDDAATVTLDTPDSQDTVSDGDYIVFEWESERLTDAYQEVSMTIAESG